MTQPVVSIDRRRSAVYSRVYIEGVYIEGVRGVQKVLLGDRYVSVFHFRAQFKKIFNGLRDIKFKDFE